MRIAIYCRVSTQDQTTENQRLRLTEYARRKGWEYDVIEEVMSTRKTRPKKYNLMQQLRRKKYDGVLVFKIDRWARSSYELLTEIQELHKKEIKFISYSDNINLSSPTGKLQFQILSAFAEFERNLIRERTIEGLARAKSQGKKLGRPKGSKDKKIRRKSGYYLRQAKQRQRSDEVKGNYKPIEYYLDNPPHNNSN